MLFRSPFVRGQIADRARREPRSRETADHSFYYLVAIALLDGALTPHQFEEGRWLEPSVRTLMERINIQADPDLNAYTPASFPCTLTLVTRDGSRRAIEMPYAPGHPRNPMSQADVEAKFHASAEGLLPDPPRNAVVQRVEALEELASVRELMLLLAGAPAGATA